MTANTPASRRGGTALPHEHPSAVAEVGNARCPSAHPHVTTAFRVPVTLCDG
ncbi:hypothetical protein [Streptomyces lydicus]|uniref:hypothetical protein n=1 Tax=Streptomyces lydicus TaxID=47763 RepID=UPI00286FF218|nr:hypothetical protein [Streptomyces lydicus]